MADTQDSRARGLNLEAPGTPDLAFGPFVLQRAAKQLLEDGRPLRIGGRAFDLLTLLVERAGEVVSKAELIAHAWPNTVVEDINLRVHVAAIRKALGDGQQGVRYIASVAGRGYAFVNPVVVAPIASRASTLASVRRHNLPATLTRLLGREEQARRVEELLQTRRFVSIVGPAGIGKTALGMFVGSRLVESFAHGVWLVELANVTDPEGLVAAVADGVEFTAPAEHAVVKLASFLRPKSLLLVLDNCEHLVGAVAALAVRLLKSAPGLHLLLTSREQTRAEGEWVVRLPTLGLPPENVSVTIAQSLASPAVQLFVERAIASQDGFEVNPGNVDQVVELCRKLDGLPFAIELAAARVDTFGVAGTLKLIEEHSRMLAGNSRALLPRHRAMSALLDWGYDLLTAAERTLFVRLSIFRGGFSAEWALVVGEAEAGDGAVFDGIASLTTKSLLMAQAGEDDVEYRMLQTTRDYAFGKLQSGDDLGSTRRRHAQLLRDFFSGHDESRNGFRKDDWHVRHGRCMDDIRFALDWAFAPAGDPALAVELTVATVELGLQLGLLEETRRRVAHAVETLNAGGANIDPNVAIRLQIAHASISTQTEAPSDTSSSRFDKLTALSDHADVDPHRKVELANALWLSALASGDYPGCRRWARKIVALARETAHPDHVLLGERTMASAEFYLGRFAQSMAHVNCVLAAKTSTPHIGSKGLAPPDRRVTMGIVKARALWITGFADQACELVQEVLAIARSDVAHALGQAICMAAAPIAFWTGDDTAARRLVDEGLEQTARHQMAYWHEWIRRNDLLLRWRVPKTFDDGLPALSIETAQQRDFFCTVDTALLEDVTIDRVDRGLVGWCAAEVRRATAVNLLRATDDMAFEPAALLLDQALTIARTQGAFAWELRAATTLAQLWLRRGNRGFALACLAPAVECIKEGSTTLDVRAAKALMERLESAPSTVGAGEAHLDDRTVHEAHRMNRFRSDLS